MPNQKELIEKILEEIAKSAAMLQEKNPRIDIEENARLLKVVAEALKKNDYEGALSLVQQSQPAVRPNTEYSPNKNQILKVQGTDIHSEQVFPFTSNSSVD
jgi:hypothetical protein